MSCASVLVLESAADAPGFNGHRKFGDFTKKDNGPGQYPASSRQQPMPADITAHNKLHLLGLFYRSVDGRSPYFAMGKHEVDRVRVFITVLEFEELIRTQSQRSWTTGKMKRKSMLVRASIFYAYQDFIKTLNSLICVLR
mmetsp:Transcript_27690/g.66709  ORF Transcript_27690/g.66709 Transcript_27690/m.66709 type:complete len:140 (-) Transcript_27690:88-507(-)